MTTFVLVMVLALLLGWPPDAFWAATPADLAMLADALAPDAGEIRIGGVAAASEPARIATFARAPRRGLETKQPVRLTA